MTIGDTTADAARPLFGTDENAIPRTVADNDPNKTIQANANHFEPNSGISNPKKSEPKKSSSTICSDME